MDQRLEQIAAIRRQFLRAPETLTDDPDMHAAYQLLGPWERAVREGRIAEADALHDRFFAAVERGKAVTERQYAKSSRAVAAGEQVMKIWREEFPEAKTLGELVALAGEERMNPLLRASFGGE